MADGDASDCVVERDGISGRVRGRLVVLGFEVDVIRGLTGLLLSPLDILVWG